MVDLPLHVGPGLCLCLDWYWIVCLSVGRCWLFCLTAYRRRDREDKGLYTSILPMTLHPSHLVWPNHNCHTICIPHCPLDQWVTQLAR